MRAQGGVEDKNLMHTRGLEKRLSDIITEHHYTSLWLLHSPTVYIQLVQK